MNGISSRTQAAHTTRVACFFVLMSLPVIVSGEVSSSFDKAASAVVELRLYDDPEWLALGHYRRDKAGWRSSIDDPEFFLSATGRTDPQAELLSTIQAMYGEPEAPGKPVLSRYIARCVWLRERLATIGETVPPFFQSDFDQRFATNEMPTKIILAFPSPSADGVSSAFGHLFLIFARSDRSRLLAPTASYAALVDADAGLFYPFLGLCGGFKSYFTMLTHADRLKEYGSIASRDIWEYELDLNPHEVARLFRHTWELRQIYSHYYFLTKNCAYGILRLLDVARPGLCPSSFDQKAFVVPIDVVRHLQKAGLVNSVRYIPSTLTEMRQVGASLSWRDKLMARKIAHGKMLSGRAVCQIPDPVKRADIISAAMLLSKLRVYAGDSTVGEHKQILSSIIGAAAETPLGEGYEMTSAAPPTPEQAHRLSRVLAGTVHRNDSMYWLIGVRPAYHDFLDPAVGMDAGTQLQILNSEILGDESGKIAAWRLCIFETKVLKVSDALYRPLSYQFGADLTYWHEDEAQEQWNGVLKGGLGYAYAPFIRTRLFTMWDAQLQSRSLGNDSWGGIGPSLGMVADLLWGLQGFVEGRYQWKAIGSTGDRYEWTSGVSISLNERMSVACQYSEEKFAGHPEVTEFKTDFRFNF